MTIHNDQVDVPSRAYHGMEVFDGKMWIFGGVDED